MPKSASTKGDRSEHALQVRVDLPDARVVVAALDGAKPELLLLRQRDAARDRRDLTADPGDPGPTGHRRRNIPGAVESRVDVLQSALVRGPLELVVVPLGEVASKQELRREDLVVEETRVVHELGVIHEVEVDGPCRGGQCHLSAS
jgi:hypothetical protein